MGGPKEKLGVGVHGCAPVHCIQSCFTARGAEKKSFISTTQRAQVLTYVRYGGADAVAIYQFPFTTYIYLQCALLSHTTHQSTLFKITKA